MKRSSLARMCASAAAVAVMASQSGAAQDAGVVAACVGAAGQTRIVDQATTCRPSESRVTWNVAGPKGDKGDKGDPGEAAAGGGGLRLVDANDTDLGPYSTFNSVLLVPRPGHDGLWLQIVVGADGFAPAAPSFVFKTACPGTGLHDPSERYVFSSGVGPALLTPLVAFTTYSGGTLYYGSVASELFAPLSQETTHALTGVTSCVNAPFPVGRYSPVQTTPAPEAVAPFKLVVK